VDAYAAAIGLAIRTMREERGLSQERLAELAGVHRTYVGGVERGERNVTVNGLAKFAEGLGVEPSEIVRLADGARSDPSG